MTRRSGWSRAALCVVALSASATLGAQQDSSSARDTLIAWRPLPVMDHAGNEIPDSLIVATMRPSRVRTWRVVLGAVTGMIVFAAATVNEHDCSIYDPCSQREKFLASGGWITGMIVGGLVGAATSGNGIDRDRAVEIIRAQRRAQAQEQP